MYAKKRSSYFLQDDSEEEDEWEREVSTSSSKKQQQPNIYSAQLDLLDEQHSVLKDTTSELTEELKQLQTTLHDLEKEKYSWLTTVQGSKQECINSIEETLLGISIINRDSNPDNASDYLDNDTLLSEELQSIIDNIDAMFKSKTEKKGESEQKIKTLAHNFRYTEFEVFDLVAQISGLEARLRTLQRDLSKLNTLPQIIPILKAEMEKHQQEIRDTTNILGRIEQEIVRPQLIKFSELKISQPLQQDQDALEIDLCKSIEKEFAHLNTIALKQATCQLFVQEIQDQKQQEMDTRENHLVSFADLVELQVQKLDTTHNQTPHVENKEHVYIMMMKDLLDECFESNDILDTMNIKKRKEELTLAERIEILKEYEIRLREKWGMDFHSCTIAGNILGEMQSKLFHTLYSHSQTTDELVLTPKHYLDLQEQLKSKTTQLQESIGKLETQIDNHNENFILDQLRKLFITFYNEPDNFLDHFENIKKEMKESFII